MQRLLSFVSLLLASATLSGISALQGESIFLKAYLGGGYLFNGTTYWWETTSGDVVSPKLTFQGPAGFTMLQAGGSLSQTMKAFAFTSFMMAPKPNFKAEGIKVDTVYDYLTISDLGIGLGYYDKTGLSVSLGFSYAHNYYKYSVYGQNIGTFSKTGFGIVGIVGMDFPLSGHLTYGISLITYYGRVLDVGPYDGLNYTNMYAGLAASLMYD